MKYAELKDISIYLEHFVTPVWPIRAVMAKELMTQLVIDPCVGSGVMAHEAAMAGYIVEGFDVIDWGYHRTTIKDFLSLERSDIPDREFTVFMNPPFSLACQFVEKAFELGARKIIMFQRFAFWESDRREKFWTKYPPNRIYICRDRADCWRFDLPKIPGKPDKRLDPEKDKELSSSPTAHAFFVFEPGHPSGTLTGHISKKDVPHVHLLKSDL